MKELKHLNPETAPSPDEAVDHTPPVHAAPPHRKSCGHGSSISCLSMKSDFSKNQPMHFRGDQQENRYEDVKASHHHRSRPEELELPWDCLPKDRLSVEQSADVLECYQRELKLCLKQKYEPLVEGQRTQRVDLREGLRADLHQTKQKCPDSVVDCSELFRSSPGRRGSVRTLLTVGPAGVGKSLLVQSRIVDWCEDRALQHVQLLCPLPFSQLNLLQHQSGSLLELLQTFCPGLRESGITNLCHHRVLFILDGLDECRLPLDFSMRHRCCDAEAAMPLDALLTNLILGNLLPDAQLWITSRPTAVCFLPPTLIHRLTEVRGFSSHQQEAYFLQNIQDEAQARTVSAKVRSCAPLHSMCNLPLFCSIMASVCADTSITQVFLHFLSAHMRNMQHRYGLHKSRVSSVVQALCRLAHQQLQRGEVFFYEDHVRACGVEVTEALVYSGLCTQVFTEDSFRGHRAFSFVHLSMHEFLAALFVHMSFCGDREDIHGALRDHPTFLQFLLELSLDSSVSRLIQRSFSVKTLTDSKRRSAQVYTDPEPGVQPGLRKKSSHKGKQQCRHCAGPKPG